MDSREPTTGFSMTLAAGGLFAGFGARRLRRRLRCPHQGRASHALIGQALLILENLDHRGAVGADPLCGDGAGILVQIPDALYREELAGADIALPPPGEYGVGMIFLPQEHASRLACEQNSSARCARKARWCSAGATCRSTTRCRCRRW